MESQITILAFAPIKSLKRSNHLKLSGITLKIESFKKSNHLNRVKSLLNQFNKLELIQFALIEVDSICFDLA